MSNPSQRRDSSGRFKPDHRTRNTAIGATAVAGIAVAAVGAAFRFGWFDRFLPATEGHDAPDLALDATTPGTDRAPDAFRPDPTAIPTAGEREGLRPPPPVATGFTTDDARSEELTAA
ncbi:MAG: hypothetical protein J0J06_14140 [Sphingomonas sp.]|uniref:hypothetical protein n=1 Tax=Sphingomonas sp. TaxID=28214 RepID=UPI001AC9BB4B|nr:hypothetical protein [Sphingomonas sp.]MBN8816572.1 hypothetical protein [Sphingomonas sp.]